MTVQPVISVETNLKTIDPRLSCVRFKQEPGKEEPVFVEQGPDKCDPKLECFGLWKRAVLEVHMASAPPRTMHRPDVLLIGHTTAQEV